MAEESCKTYGYEPSEELHKIFTEYHKTHNQAVFEAYTPEMKKARHNKIITGLPDAYGRGRIVGDYRRVALYGIDFLIEKKQEDMANCGDGTMTEDVIRLRGEIADQLNACLLYTSSERSSRRRRGYQWMYQYDRTSEDPYHERVWGIHGI